MICSEIPEVSLTLIPLVMLYSFIFLAISLSPAASPVTPYNLQFVNTVLMDSLNNKTDLKHHHHFGLPKTDKFPEQNVGIDIRDCFFMGGTSV